MTGYMAEMRKLKDRGRFCVFEILSNRPGTLEQQFT